MERDEKTFGLARYWLFALCGAHAPIGPKKCRTCSFACSSLVFLCVPSPVIIRRFYMFAAKQHTFLHFIFRINFNRAILYSMNGKKDHSTALSCASHKSVHSISFGNKYQSIGSIGHIHTHTVEKGERGHKRTFININNEIHRKEFQLNRIKANGISNSNKRRKRSNNSKTPSQNFDIIQRYFLAFARFSCDFLLLSLSRHFSISMISSCIDDAWLNAMQRVTMTFMNVDAE